MLEKDALVDTCSGKQKVLLCATLTSFSERWLIHLGRDCRATWIPTGIGGRWKIMFSAAFQPRDYLLFPPHFFDKTAKYICIQKKVLPVFSLISQRTLKSAGFILWQFSPCFLFQYKTRHDTEINSLISHRSTTEQDFLFLRGWRLYKFYHCHASLQIRMCYFQQMEFKDTLRWICCINMCMDFIFAEVVDNFLNKLHEVKLLNQTARAVWFNRISKKWYSPNQFLLIRRISPWE